MARTVLALDTAGNACSVAVWRGRVLAEESAVMSRGQSEVLLPMVERVMKRAEAAFGGIDLVAVTRGPGGFTGVRIGLAAARGLALALGVPVLGYTSFETVAAAVPDSELGEGPLLVALNAKRREVYVQCFSHRRLPLSEPLSLTPDEVHRHLRRHLTPSSLVLAGDSAGDVAAALAGRGLAIRLSSATGHAEAAVLAALAGSDDESESEGRRASPLYIRAPDVTVAPAARPA